MIKRYFSCVVVLILCLAVTGCAALQRKFTRRKKKEEKVTAVVTTFDYSKELRVEELYKKHYLFWKTWQMELIEKMGAGVKKRTRCYDYTAEHLSEMAKYLKEPKASELEKFIKELGSIDNDIKERILSRNKEYRMKKFLETMLRQVERRFSYSDVKDYLELRKQ